MKDGSTSREAVGRGRARLSLSMAGRAAENRV